LVALGKIIRLIGKKGELRFRPYEGNKYIPAPGEEILIGGKNQPFPYRLESLSKIKTDLVLKLYGIDSREAAFPLVGQDILVDEKRLPELAEGEFYEYQLIGCVVQTRDSKEVGEVSGFWEVGGKIIMVVKAEEQEILIPFETAICQSIDVANRIITVDPPDGLLDLNEI
jgi:16S rRNA processing protein RimM